MKAYKSRDEVEEKYKWDLSDFFKNEDEFLKTYEEVSKNIKTLSTYEGCTKDADELYRFLTLEMDTIALWEDLYVYAYLINDQELGKAESIERKNKVELLNLELEKSINFFAPELLKLTQEEYDKLFEGNTRLNEFRKALDKVYREKGHVLSTNEEIIISSLVSSMNHFDDMSSTLLNNCHDYGRIKIDNDEFVIATNNYRHLMRISSSEVRHKVRNQFQSKLSDYSMLNAMFLNSYVSMQDTIAKIRGFSSAWDRKMYGWNLESSVFKTLVDTVESNLDSLHRYYNLRRKVLKLNELTSYDLYLELSHSNRDYSIEDAQKLVLSSLKPLGDEYLEKFKKIFNNRYIDYCQYKGKCSGGYSFSTMRNDSRILMSFNGELECVSTIAHEGGHNVHHQFVKENNPLQYRDVSSIVCEVASLTNECLLSSYLATNGRDREEKLAGIANILDVIISNLFGAVREGKIEEEMYSNVNNGGTLTTDYMDQLSYSSLEKYYGDSVIIDDMSKNGWINRSHYYMNFYLYSYAICISVACGVANKILNGDKSMLDKYLSFLKTGSDMWPSEAFALLGVDLGSKDTYEDAIHYFDSMVNLFEKIYNE